MTAVFAFKRKAQKTNLTIRTFLLTIKSRLLSRVAGFNNFYSVPLSSIAPTARCIDAASIPSIAAERNKSFRVLS